MIPLRRARAPLAILALACVLSGAAKAYAQFSSSSAAKASLPFKLVISAPLGPGAMSASPGGLAAELGAEDSEESLFRQDGQPEEDALRPSTEYTE